MRRLLAALALGAALLPGTLRAEGVVLDDFEQLTGWTATASEGTHVWIAPETGRTGMGMRIGFDLNVGGGYVIVRKSFAVTLPENYAFSFQVRGDARPQGYYMAVIKSDGTYLYSSFALLGHDATTWATGDISRLAVRTVAPGLARLVLYRNGSPIFSYDDADHFVASGRPGIGLSAGTEGISLDDWEAGELISAP